MHLLVTRPQPQADEWVQRLRAAGLAVHALPLIDIAAAPDPQAVHRAWAQLDGVAMVMFVSPNAVERFFDARPAACAWPAGAWAGATGPGTSAALRARGVPGACIVEPPAAGGAFDSEALWRQLAPQRDWQGARVLVVRGEGGRDWLATTLAQQGAQVAFAEAYRRLPPTLDAAHGVLLQGALQRPREHLWCFSSSQAVGHLTALAPEADWAAAQAVATHPRIAERARSAGFGRVLQTGPQLDELLRAVASIQSPAP